MTLVQFQTISKHSQHRNLLIDGACIAYRITDEHSILLFQQKGTYTELYLNLEGNEVENSRTFDNTEELTPYLEAIPIPYF